MLVTAVRLTVLSIIDQEDPESSQGLRHARRKLVSFSPDVPIFHSNIIEDDCGDGFNPSVHCIIMKTVVTLFLEPDDDPDTVRADIVSGFLDAFDNGSFMKILTNL